MKPLLPVVDSEVGFSLAKTVGEHGDAEFINSELQIINKENPTVASFIKRWAELSGCSTHTTFCGILVYKLLRSQAEADRMTEELNL
jgi:hypothetical protein